VWLFPLHWNVRRARPSHSGAEDPEVVRGAPHCLAWNAPQAMAWGTRMRKVSMATRRELVRAITERDVSSRRIDKTKVLDEFVALIGHHRKHAMRLLRAPRGSSTDAGGGKRLEK
jgi:hypothetical protein